MNVLSPARPPARALLLSLSTATLALAAPAAAETAVHLVPAQAQQQAFVQDLHQASDPQGALNCFVLHAVREEVQVIVQNDLPGHLAHTADVRRLARIAVLTALDPALGGPIPALVASGAVGGMEIEWVRIVHEGSPQQYLDTVGWMYEDDDPQQPPILRLVLLSPQQYTARRLEVEGMLGHPMDDWHVWSTPTVGALPGAASDLAIELRGSDVHGVVRSGGALVVGGNGSVYHDGAVYCTTAEVTGTAVVEPLVQANGFPAPSCDVDLDALRAAAIANGTYHDQRLTITDRDMAPPSGVVFAEGHLTVLADDLQREWTLVSALGEVRVLGDRNVLRPATVDAATGSFPLIVAPEGPVELGGDSNHWMGEVLAPLDKVRVNGSDNRFLGTILASQVDVLGRHCLLGDGTEPAPPMPTPSPAP